MFTEGDLRALAGPASFGRARDYLDSVEDLEIEAGHITAMVSGSDDYDVTLTTDSAGALSGDCDCPFGQDGNFCKHCVAVGLVALSGRAEQADAKAGRGERLESWLTGLSRDDLLALLREQLAADKNLRRRLETRAAAGHTIAGGDVAVLRARIADLFDTRRFSQYGYVEYADVSAFAAQAQEAVAVLRSLAAAGHASQAVTLSRESITLLGKVYEEIDDSSGAVSDVAAGIELAHRDACVASGTDPLDLADWLAGHMLGAWSHLPELEFDDYRDLLGETGRERLRQVIAEAFRRDPSDWTAKYLMEEILRGENDVDALVALLAADLAPHGGTHLTIAEELDAAGRSPDALEWAERGLRDTTGSPYIDVRLVDYVADRYERAGRHTDALAVRRQRFHASPTLADYQKLRSAARAAGCWEAERAAALELLTDVPVGRDHVVHRGTVLVDVLIDDGEIDAAWRAAKGRADRRQWLTLAGLVGDERPADALEVYRQAIEPLKKITGDGNYREIASLLLLARDCHRALGTDAEFTEYVNALRAGQRRKRNLMKILDQHGL